MSILPILTWPDPRLSEVADPVGAVDAGVLRLAEDMLETMYAAPGRGLAGPQVGAMRRIFVMDAGWKDGEPTPSVCIDPKILESSGETVTCAEGCLSIPGIAADIARPETIRLAWTTREGERIVAALSGDSARIAQHEIDHLDGIVTLDRLDADARARALAAYGAEA